MLPLTSEKRYGLLHLRLLRVWTLPIVYFSRNTMKWTQNFSLSICNHNQAKWWETYSKLLSIQYHASSATARNVQEQVLQTGCNRNVCNKSCGNGCRLINRERKQAWIQIYACCSVMLCCWVSHCWESLNIFLKLLDTEDEREMMLGNVSKLLSQRHSGKPWRLEFSTTPLWQTQI